MDNQDIAALFRKAMRYYPAAVTVVTCSSAAGDVGMTASAVTSLSMDPPSLLVCINRAAQFHGVIEENQGFCVNLLRQGHENISANFGGAKPAEQRFLEGDWLVHDGLPYLADAQASIFCRRAAMFAHGTHSIVVGEATGLLLHDPLAPLLYLDGRYAAVAPKEG